MASDGQVLRYDESATGSLAADMGQGLLASFALHAAVLLIILLSLLWVVPKPLEQTRVLTVNLVRFAATATVPAAARGTPAGNNAADATALPLVEPVTTPVPRKTPSVAGSKEVVTVPVPNFPSGMATIALTVALPPPPRFEPRPPPNANEELAARLRMFAHLREPATHGPPDEPGFNGTGHSESAADSTAPDATSAVKDFIRAQVERRWNLDRREIGAHEWIVGIRILLARDGKVLRAEIVRDTRHTSDSYLDFARSARNAVLVSSPLALPPGTYTLAHDIVVDFDSRDAAR